MPTCCWSRPTTLDCGLQHDNVNVLCTVLAIILIFLFLHVSKEYSLACHFNNVTLQFAKMWMVGSGDGAG